MDPRPALDDEYGHFTAKGSELWRYLKSPSAAGEHAKSRFDQWEMLEAYGWVEQASSAKQGEDFGIIDGIDHILRGAKGTQVMWRHGTTISSEDLPEGHVYKATDALYQNVFLPEAGVILAFANDGLDSSGNEGLNGFMWDDEKNHLTPLKHWSDVAYLSWKKAVSAEVADIGNLQFVLRRTVNNHETLGVLTRILRDRYPEEEWRWIAPFWPDKEVISWDDEGFKPMLYTPNVRGAAWLLIQHSEIFRKKIIRSVTAYFERGCVDAHPNLLIEIGDQPSVEGGR
ncbi:uncharacterized protein LTR77_001099 [Saxophila tyrrhenica]|uniref:Uncharacterized protein n=1 Tax=Saxophila tyrrhenica TaxID=1690608 RepID=A0AAV9PP27_9PEZI|nr:hypothetical protein LTR77_001099 [Saxophila tyrrhenica]